MKITTIALAVGFALASTFALAQGGGGGPGGGGPGTTPERAGGSDRNPVTTNQGPGSNMSGSATKGTMNNGTKGTTGSGTGNPSGAAGVGTNGAGDFV